jgi:hypothetical protein
MPLRRAVSPPALAPGHASDLDALGLADDAGDLLYPVDGAVHDVGASETAFAYRDAVWSGVIGGIDPDPAEAATLKEWCVSYWEALHPHSMGGAYVNFMMDEGQARIQASFRGNYQRLAEIKTKYDPDNFFHINQNIEPAR